MSQRLISLFFSAVCGLLAGTATPASEISGRWHAQFDTPIGQQNYLFSQPKPAFDAVIAEAKKVKTVR